MNLGQVITTDNFYRILNRIYVVSKVKGNKLALQEAEKLNLKDNHFYYLLLGKLSEGLDNDRVIIYLEKAIKLCKTETEKIFIKNKMDSLK